MAADHFCLRWNNYQSNMVSELDMLRTEEYLVDVTLCCDGHKFRAHKVILSACSPYFRNVFKENPCEHPVVILKDVSSEDVEALLSFVYQGVVYVSEKKLASFLQTAELLQIKGLAGAASSFSDEQAKNAISGQQTPVKRRKSAPVRIVKQEDGDDTSNNQMDADDDSSRNEYSEDMIEEMKNEEDEGSPGEDSDTEGGGGGGVGGVGSEVSRGFCNSTASVDSSLPPEHRDHRQDSLLHSTIQRPQPTPPVPPLVVAGNFQVPVQNQGLSEILSPAGDRNGRRPCPLCTKVISNKSNLLKHMRIRHSDAYNPACCMLCNKVFKNKYSLRAHLNIYHKEYIAPTNQHPPQPPQIQVPCSSSEIPSQPQYLSGVSGV